MKKQVFCGVFALALAVTGCGVQKKEAASDIVPENRQELTILHVDAGTEGFDSFISQAEKRSILKNVRPMRTIARPK